MREDANVAKAVSQLGLDLLSRLHERSPTENIVVSPLSVALALAMTCSGAAGETERAMLETLHLRGSGRDNVNASFSDLLGKLAALDPKVSMQLAQSLWLRDGFTPRPDFVTSSRRHYGAVVRALDFESPGAVATINDWVASATQRMVNSVVDDLHGQLMVLASALYFRGAWARAFDATLTSTDTFHGARGATRVPLMLAGRDDFAYFEDEHLQAVDLPFGNGALGMAVLLPRANRDVREVLTRLRGAGWGEVAGAFRRARGTLIMPRFDVEHESKLDDVLRALGMGIAFTVEADFSGIAPGLAISTVRHKSRARVDEEGAEAAAATAVLTYGATATAGGTAFSMEVNRPFVFVIHAGGAGPFVLLGTVAVLER